MEAAEAPSPPSALPRAEAGARGEGSFDPQPRGAVLDVDGTLLLSNEAHARAWALALAESARGGDVTHTDVLPLIGMGGDLLIRQLTRLDPESDEAHELEERKKAIFTERFLESLRAAPGARALLERLRDDGLDLVVATSASGEELHGLLEQAGVADLIEAATSASDVKESKPAPDVVEAAIAKVGHAPSELVMIGDTPYDVAAAMDADVRIIAVRCGGWDDESLRGSIAVYDHPAHLLREYEQSVFGRHGRRS